MVVVEEQGPCLRALANVRADLSASMKRSQHVGV